ncbi:MAG TPA: hypothetical protein EYM69_07930 [Dehalococcoidia bacterium]|nr:hypothetical protein [Dehalococcoidia bacterium]
MPDKTRFEREIDEILESSEGEPKSKRTRKRQFEPFSPKVPKRRSPVNSGGIKFNPGRVIILGLVILAVAAFTPAAKVPLAIIGALLVVIGYAASFRRGGGRLRGETRVAERSRGREPQVKYWRGRRVEGKPESPDSGGSAGRGKIIDFVSPGDDPGADEREPDDK